VRLSPSAISRLRAAIDLRELAKDYLAIKQGKSLCPFHSEKTPSLVIHEQYFKCFGCQASGDAIAFLRRIEGISFTEACTRLAERFGVSLEGSRDPAAERRAAELARREGDMAAWWWRGMLRRGAEDLDAVTVMRLFRWARTPAMEQEYGEMPTWRDWLREVFTASEEGARAVCMALDNAARGPLVILNLDSDDAGKLATMRSGLEQAAMGCRVRVLQLPCDADEFVAMHGAEAYREATEQALPLFTWLACGSPTLRLARAWGECG
jgi:DNA primase